MPIGPQPVMSTVAPGMSAVSAVWNALPIGSWMPPMSYEMLSSRCQTFVAGHRDVLGEASVAIDADDLRVRTDVGVSGAAEQAASVDDVSLGGHAIAFLHVGDELADLHDVAGELVADDERRLARARAPSRPSRRCERRCRRRRRAAP